MIASLSGRIQDVHVDNLIVDVGGIGLQVFAPTPLLDRLRPSGNVFLHTYLVVREDALTLFGFETKDERDLFILLLSVNGVGPKLALAVQSVLSPDAIRRAVYHEQSEVFSRVPGVGKKTAQKILLQLQDRIPTIADLEPISMISDVDTEVMAALATLGYSVVEAQAAVQAIPRDAPQDVDTRLRLALQYFI